MPIPIEKKSREQWLELLAGYLWEGGKREHLFAGSKNRGRAVEALHLVRKLRWIGMEEEAERVETKLHETTLAGGVITAAHETD